MTKRTLRDRFPNWHGWPALPPIAGGQERDQETADDVAALLEPGYRQQAAIPLLAATHEGSDVVAAAIGPGAEQVRGFLEQTDPFGVVRRALGL